MCGEIMLKNIAFCFKMPCNMHLITVYLESNGFMFCLKSQCIMNGFASCGL